MIPNAMVQSLSSRYLLMGYDLIERAGFLPPPRRRENPRGSKAKEGAHFP